MAGLLVSVRSAVEACAALDGGAAVIDVKEPRSGPLGMADPAVWRSIVEAVDGRAAVSVALGELREREREAAPPNAAWNSIRWRKLGLAGLRDEADWPVRWAALRSRCGPGPGWIAVVYVDAESAGAPGASVVADEAVRAGCAGVLFDTWDKARRSPMRAGGVWAELVDRIRGAGGLVVIAGGLDVEGIGRLKALEPDYFAVRGAACGGSDRLGRIDADRVARLAEAACS